MTPRRSFWAWGLESEEPTDEDRARRAEHLSKRFGVTITPAPVPDLADAELRPARIRVPDALAGCCTTETWERAFHSHGAHFTDRTDAFNLHFPNPTDVVAHPRSEDELVAVLDWCSSNGAKVVPFGAGSSVVWGVNPPEADAVVTVAMDRFDRVLELDPVSRAARIQAGIYGPELEAQLRPEGFTLRHFPQSFRFSTLGGWIATRSGGHYATNHTHIDDFVESVRMLTPQGWWESRRLPGSGAGPSPDRMVIGSEGILGVITEAWMRIQRRPTFRATAGIVFPTWEAGADAVRQIVQAKLWPANCRILDPVEAGRAAGLDGTQSLVIVSFESAELSQRHPIGVAVDLARGAGGVVEDDAVAGRRRGGPADRTRRAASAPGGTRSSASTRGSTPASGSWPTPSRRRSRGTAGPSSTRSCGSGCRRRCTTCSVRRPSSRADSPTSTRTGRRRTTRGSAWAGRGPSDRSGRR